MPKVNFYCFCGGHQLVIEENIVQYKIIDRTYRDNDGPIIQISGFHSEKVNNSLNWETYRCYKCKKPLPVTNREELWDWLVERDMLDPNN